MRLTKQTDYSLRVLIFLGARDGGPATIDQVAQAYDISRNHLMKVVYHLGNAGILETTRGRHGGFRLARPARDIRLGSVIRTTEPDFAIVECLDKNSDVACVIDGPCKLKGILRNATEAWLTALDDYTLEDLIEPRKALVQLLHA